jgi:hypothetical protein
MIFETCLLFIAVLMRLDLLFVARQRASHEDFTVAPVAMISSAFTLTKQPNYSKKKTLLTAAGTGSP